MAVRHLAIFPTLLILFYFLAGEGRVDPPKISTKIKVALKLRWRIFFDFAKILILTC